MNQSNYLSSSSSVSLSTNIDPNRTSISPTFLDQATGHLDSSMISPGMQFRTMSPVSTSPVHSMFSNNIKLDSMSIENPVMFKYPTHMSDPLHVPPPTMLALPHPSIMAAVEAVSMMRPNDSTNSLSSLPNHMSRVDSSAMMRVESNNNLHRVGSAGMLRVDSTSNLEHLNQHHAMTRVDSTTGLPSMQYAEYPPYVSSTPSPAQVQAQMQAQAQYMAKMSNIYPTDNQPDYTYARAKTSTTATMRAGGIGYPTPYSAPTHTAHSHNTPRFGPVPTNTSYDMQPQAALSSVGIGGGLEDEEDDEDVDAMSSLSPEEKAKLRLARKAELARASRRRKKMYVKDLEDKVKKLSAKVEEMRLLQLATAKAPNDNPLVLLHELEQEFKADRIDRMKLLKEQISGLVALDAVGSLDRSQTQQLKNLLQQFIEVNRGKQPFCNYHLDQASDYATPSLQVRFLMWGLTQNDQFYVDLDTQPSLWSTLMKDEIKLSDAQIADIKQKSDIIKFEKNELHQCIEQLKEVRERLDKHHKRLSQSAGELQNIYTPIQLAKYYLWVERNEWCMEMLDTQQGNRSPTP